MDVVRDPLKDDVALGDDVARGDDVAPGDSVAPGDGVAPGDELCPNPGQEPLATTCGLYRRVECHHDQNETKMKTIKFPGRMEVSPLIMETIPGSSSKLSLGSEVATGDAGISSRNLFTDNELPSSVHTVVSHDDLLIEILLRLPILSLILFKSVSKHWLSLIRNINPTLRRTTNPNLDPPTGLFIQRLESPSLYDFVSLDSRILSRIYPMPFKFIFPLNSQIRFNILESCNGLLLCEGVNQDII
ncbi:F-box protein-like protein [Tanacetum coccineum]